MAFYTDFAGHYDQIFPFRAGVLAFLDQWLPPEGRILDVGCGTGIYCAGLQESGRTCLGIDLDPGMIGEAERRHPKVDFRIMGMEEIRLLPAGGFAGVFCIGNVLPHLAAGRLAAFLMDVKNLLVPGGIWIYQTVNFDPIPRGGEFVMPDITLPADNLVFRRRYDDIRVDRLTFHTALTGPQGEIFSGEVELYPRTSVDYLHGHRTAGFAKLGHFADFSGRGYRSQEHSGSVYVFRRDE